MRDVDAVLDHAPREAGPRRPRRRRPHTTFAQTWMPWLQIGVQPPGGAEHHRVATAAVRGTSATRRPATVRRAGPPYASTSTIIARHSAAGQSRAEQSLSSRDGIGGQAARRSSQAILPGALDTRRPREHIHHMMTSSHDELIRRRREPAVSIEHLTVVRGKRTARGRRLRAHRAGHDHRAARSVGLRQDHVDARHRRHPDRRVGHGHGARPSGRIRRTAPPRRLRHPVRHHLRRPPRHRQRALLRRRCTAATRRPPTRRSTPSGSPTTELRCAATCPADNAPGRRWPAHWCRTPICSCSDEPTVGLDPVLRVDLWDQFHQLARRGTTLLVSSHVMDEADHCGDLLLLREGRLLAHTTPTQLREDTGCQSLEEAFLSIIRHSTAA